MAWPARFAQSSSPIPRSGRRLLGQGQSARLERRRLPRGQRIDIEIGDQLVEESIPVDLGFVMKKYRAKADGGAVHEDEFARRPHAAEATHLAVHLLRHVAAIDPAILLLDLAAAIIEQRRVDEARPLIQAL